jgi:aminoacyl tRNA synthase complex-interacting multifunctional protein 1
MLINCSKEFDDIRFALKVLNPGLEINRKDSGIELIKEDLTLSDLDSVLDFCINEYKDKKSVKDIKRLRTTLETVPLDNSFSSYISLYNCLKDLLIKTNLKNVKYVEDMLKEYKMEYLLFYLLRIQVGEIVKIDDVDGSDKLYVEQVNTGTKLQIVSGVRELYSKEFLLGKKILFITNIKKSKIRGNESNGMILCAKQGDKVEALFVNDGLAPGTIATIEGDDLINDIEVGTIDLKKTFYKNLFDKLQIKDSVLLYERSKVLVDGGVVESKILNGIIS